jgi:hypothetical protein
MTSYELWDRRSIRGGADGFLFSTTSRLFIGPIQLPNQWVWATLSRGQSGRRVKMTAVVYLASDLVMRRALLSHPLYAFMVRFLGAASSFPICYFLLLFFSRTKFTSPWRFRFVCSSDNPVYAFLKFQISTTDSSCFTDRALTNVLKAKNKRLRNVTCKLHNACSWLQAKR